ncbi:MAG: AMP-binding protein [Acidimicrobiales bacterium]
MTSGFSDLLRSRYRSAGDRPFLRAPGGPIITYRQFDERAGRMATALTDAGVGPGDRVVAQVAKSSDNVALYLGCLRIGAVYVPLNSAYTAEEIAYFVDDAEPSLVVLAPEASVPTAVAGQAAGLMTLAPDGRGTLAEAADAAAVTQHDVPRADHDPAAMIYTSGTTGRSKGAVLTHRNLAGNALSLHRIWGFVPGDVLLHGLPIFHVHGLMVALHTAMLNASEVIFLPRFDVDTIIAELPRATVMMGVPTHYTRLLADGRFGAEICSRMRLFTSGSAPMTESTHRRFTRRTGHRILERYGMSETGMITSNPYDGQRVPGTVGYALPDVEVRVCDTDGAELARGETGVVEVRGPNVFAGYWRRPEKTAADTRSDGFFVTGDVGHLDADGRLTLEGRSSDMIISGGYNIYPKEIELLIDECAGVRESAVVGLPHPDFGEAVTAFVVPTRAEALDPAAIDAALDGRLARFKHPKRYVGLDELPRNAMGKVQKKQLRVDHADLYAD